MGDDPAQFALALDELRERCTRICSLERQAHGAQNTGATEWYTPAEFIATARQVMGVIDLDSIRVGRARWAVSSETRSRCISG
jgi:hypothetical protein